MILRAFSFRMVPIQLIDAVTTEALCSERNFRDHTDLFDETDEGELNRLRFPRAMLLDLCNTHTQFRRNTRRSDPVPPHLQVLSALGVLATGSFQREIGDSISQSSLNRALQRVVKAILSIRQTEIRNAFLAKAGPPNIIGKMHCHLVNVGTRWPGGAHDSFVKSSVGMRLAQGAGGHGWLIGK